MLYDAFISHASEDKDLFVRELAARLRAEHIEVWYDEFSLQVGDSLRRSIDRGLAQSRFGIAVLSPRFFEKQWSQWELDGLVARQVARADSVILPIWLDLGRDEVLEFSPPLADKFAISAADGLDAVVSKLTSAIRPRGSTLVIARDFLLDRGFDPPVVTDDWWLDVAAAAESNDAEGTWQEAMGWGRWGFPLPEFSNEPAKRGVRLGRAALQMQWLLAAQERPITQMTPPSELHEFIESQVGLADACQEHLRYLLTYAPQLAIRGFGGPFEGAIEAMYQRSLAWYADLPHQPSDDGAPAVSAPDCHMWAALRHPTFGGYDPASVACAFVQGDAVANGPPVRYFGTIDYLAWLLSVRSEWLGSEVREFLTRGMLMWGVWIWDGNDRTAEELGYVPDRTISGGFGECVSRARSVDTFRITGPARRDLVARLTFSTQALDLPEPAADLAALLIEPARLAAYFEGRVKRKKARE